MNLLPFSLSLLRRFWPALVAGALVLAIIIQTFRLQATEGALSAERAGRVADRSSYERARAEATTNALAAKIETEKKHEVEREKADARAADLGEQRHAAVLRYQATQRAASVQHLPGATETASGSDRSDRSALLPLGQLMIPEADAFICANNQARLEAVREWALGL